MRSLFENNRLSHHNLFSHILHSFVVPRMSLFRNEKSAFQMYPHALNYLWKIFKTCKMLIPMKFDTFIHFLHMEAP